MNIKADIRPRTRACNRRTASSLAAPSALLLDLLLVAPDVPLLIFAGGLLSVLIRMTLINAIFVNDYLE